MRALTKLKLMRQLSMKRPLRKRWLFAHLKSVKFRRFYRTITFHFNSTRPAWWAAVHVKQKTHRKRVEWPRKCKSTEWQRRCSCRTTRSGRSQNKASQKIAYSPCSRTSCSLLTTWCGLTFPTTTSSTLKTRFLKFLNCKRCTCNATLLGISRRLASWRN